MLGGSITHRLDMAYSNNETDLVMSVASTSHGGGGLIPDNNQSFTTLSDLLTKWQNDIICSSPCNFFAMNEPSIFDMFKKEIKNPNFNEWGEIICVRNDEYESIEVRRKKMFCLLRNNLLNSSLFFGPSISKYLRYNAEALKDGAYHTAGAAIALSMVQSGLGPHFFSEKLFEFLINPEPIHIDVEIDEIQNKVIRNKVRAIHDATNETELVLAMTKAFNILSDCGCLDVVFSMNTKQEIVNLLLDFLVRTNKQKALNQFKEGLKMCDVLGYMRRYSDILKEVFCPNRERLHLESLGILRNVNFVYKDNARDWVADIKQYWTQFIKECEKEEKEVKREDCTIARVVRVISGQDVLPSYYGVLVSIQIDQNVLIPEWNTLMCQLRIGIGYDNYEEFKKWLMLAIQTAHAFRHHPFSRIDALSKELYRFEKQFIPNSLSY